jgi:hypothetical protein
MRFILTAAVWIIILAFLSLFFISRETTVSTFKKEEIKETTDISVVVTTTFSVEKDPFALDLGDKKQPFVLSLDGKTIIEKSEGVTDREPISVDIDSVNNGEHEVLVSANPSGEGKSNAVRIEVYKEGSPLKERTIWFDAGQKINASLIFNTGAENNDERSH